MNVKSTIKKPFTFVTSALMRALDFVGDIWVPERLLDAIDKAKQVFIIVFGSIFFVVWKLIKLALTILAPFATSAFHGYAVSLLWSWFVVPVFHMPYLRIPYALGLSMLFRLITWNEYSAELNPEKDPTDGEGFKKVFWVTLRANAYTGGAIWIAWIVTLFI